MCDASRLHSQYFVTDSATRRNARSDASPRPARSTAPAMRMTTVVAASESIARSARTLAIAGWSMSAWPNACRCVAWWIAWAVPMRMPPAAISAQSSRVMLTISMIVATPRPSSPTSQPSAPSYSTSLDALDLLPSLSLSRCRKKALRVPSGSTRGTRKQDRPPGAWARVRNRSDIGAEVNHLWPVSR